MVADETYFVCCEAHKRPNRIIESFLGYSISVHTLFKVCMHVFVVHDY